MQTVSALQQTTLRFVLADLLRIGARKFSAFRGSQVVIKRFIFSRNAHPRITSANKQTNKPNNKPN